MNPVQRLKRLEALVAESAATLKSLAEEKAGLLKANRELQAENKRLREELKRAGASASDRVKLRQKLERLAQKLEKIG